MKPYTPILLSLLLIPSMVTVADTYWVAFTDKKGTIGDIHHPEDFLSPQAVERRNRQCIPVDSLDLPVSHTYLDSLTRIGVDILFVSRWLNGATVRTGNSSIMQQISRFPFVCTVERTQSDKAPQNAHRKNLSIDKTAPLSYGTAKTQIEMLQLHRLHDAGYQGENICIAVIDNGFPQTDESHYFDYVRPRITHTKNFVNPEEDVFAVGGHGTNVLSCMAAYADDYCGAAPDATYCLVVTEDDYTESLREIDAQVAGFEYADSIGADIITSSLGYAFDFDDPTTDMFYSQLNGHVARNSRAATIAAHKGMIVCISVGNEGNVAWHYLSSPADADSILAVGSVTSAGVKSPFSSFGPSSDGRIKPEVCAMGTSTALYNPDTDNIRTSNGTSFSAPLIAGMAACLWQALPELSNMQIIKRILQTASQADLPDNAVGYGIPDAWAAYLGEKTGLQMTQTDVSTSSTEIYSLQGQPLGKDIHSLPDGIYIQKTENTAKKIIVTNYAATN
ncbi:MAG TPA: serine protease [Bacteroidales bacterium]|nr:serine protease [Bacteroidales bacterium]